MHQVPGPIYYYEVFDFEKYATSIKFLSVYLMFMVYFVINHVYMYLKCYKLKHMTINKILTN